MSCAVNSQLIRAFVFATQKVQSMIFFTRTVISKKVQDLVRNDQEMRYLEVELKASITSTGLSWLKKIHCVLCTGRVHNYG